MVKAVMLLIDRNESQCNQTLITGGSTFMTSNSKIDNKLVQSGRPPRVEGRHVNMPIELGSTMVFDRLEAFEAAKDRRYENGTLYYGRYGTAASYQLENMLAELEGATGVSLTSSGVSAITMALMAFVKPGAHLLAADNLYGNTRNFCEMALKPLGIEVEYFDSMIGDGVPGLIRDNTCAIIFEAPGTGTFEVPDIPAIATAARSKGVISLLDGTWATPVFCQPLSLGVDVLIYSASKYIIGHSDSMMGVIAASNAEINQKIRKMAYVYGEKPGSQEIFLALRGLRTLQMRMERVNNSGIEIASWLQDQPQVKRIIHPAFADCPGHENWKRDFTGAAGLFSVVFHPCSDEQIRDFINALHHFGIGVSWGGYESLVLPVKPHRTATTWDEPGKLVRLNIGFEDPDSLKADLAAALTHLNEG